MSFVLDALKRSEQDRNQGQVPDLSNQGALLHMNRSKNLVWPYILIVVLALNAAVFLFIHFNDDSPKQDSVVSLQTSNNIATKVDKSVMPLPAHVSPVQPLKASSLEAAVTREDMGWAEKARRAKNLIEQELYARRNGLSGFDGIGVDMSQGMRIDPRTQSERTLKASVSTANNLDVIHPKQGANPSLAMPGDGLHREGESGERQSYETLADEKYRDVRFLFEIPSASRPTIPQIRFNSHIYSDSPSARRIMINNIYLREGESLSGMEILEIGERNVVFRQGDTLFKLPAMRDWNG